MKDASIYTTIAFIGMGTLRNTIWKQLCLLAHIWTAASSSLKTTREFKKKRKKSFCNTIRSLPDVIVCLWLLFLYFLYTSPMLFLVFSKFLVWLMPFLSVFVDCMRGWIMRQICPWVLTYDEPLTSPT